MSSLLLLLPSSLLFVPVPVPVLLLEWKLSSGGWYEEEDEDEDEDELVDVSQGSGVNIRTGVLVGDAMLSLLPCVCGLVSLCLDRCLWASESINRGTSTVNHRVMFTYTRLCTPCAPVRRIW